MNFRFASESVSIFATRTNNNAKMKKIAAKLLCLVCITVAIASCDHDYDIDNPYGTVPQQALDMVESAYPGAYASWEKENGMYKAELTQYGADVEIWFTSKGVWSRTETEHFGDLSDAIYQYISVNYSGYVIDSVDYVETPSQTYYKIELERGNKDVYLRITEDGTVVK